MIHAFRQSLKRSRSVPDMNLTGYPALSIRDGFTSAGLPTSPRIGGRPFEDHLVLKAGDAFEQAAHERVRGSGGLPSFSIAVLLVAAIVIYWLRAAT